MPRIDPLPAVDPQQPWVWNHVAAILSPVSQRLVRAGQRLPDRTIAQHDTMAYSISVNVDAATPPPWQGSPVVLAPAETVAITASGQWQVVGFNWNGPDGHAGIPAYGPTPGSRPEGGYLDPGAIEGCLLVQDGTGFVQAFGPGTDVITVHAPGRISFCANDEPDPQTAVGHQGYADNKGSLTVQLSWT